MINQIFKFASANTKKLKEYGFVYSDGVYSYETTIFDEQFSMIVCINNSGEISAKVIDVNSGDEYVLHLIDGSVGEFVGKVRAEYERVLTDIRDKCFEREVFKSRQAKEVISYIRDKFGDELEFLWEKFSNNAVWRRKDNKKWYGLLVVLPRNKLGLNGDEAVDIIDLRIDPKQVDDVVDDKLYFKAYHMNKNSWFTICLDDSVPTDTIFKLIDKSYELAFKR